MIIFADVCLKKADAITVSRKNQTTDKRLWKTHLEFKGTVPRKSVRVFDLEW
jgi:hypothetical protein